MKYIELKPAELVVKSPAVPSAASCPDGLPAWLCAAQSANKALLQFNTNTVLLRHLFIYVKVIQTTTQVLCAVLSVDVCFCCDALLPVQLCSVRSETSSGLISCKQYNKHEC